MSKTVVVKTSEVSKLTRQHFGEDVHSNHPEEIQFAKKLIYEGEWEWLEDLLEPFSSQLEHSDILAAIYKRSYIELLSQPNEHSSPQQLIRLMKRVRNHSTVLYNSMLLLDQTNPQTSRHALFYKIAEYMYKYMYPSLHWKAPPTSNPSRLVELITRGLLYEQCEMITPTTDQNPPATCFCKTLFGNEATPNVPPKLSIKLSSPLPKQTLHHSLVTPPTSLMTPPTYRDVPLLSKSAVNKVHTANTNNVVATPFNRPVKLPHTSTPKDSSICKRVIVDEPVFTPITKTTKNKTINELSTIITTIIDQQAIRSIAFTSDGHHLAVGSNSRTLKIFDTNATLYKGISLPEVYSQDNYHLGSIYCLGWNNQSDLLASGSNDRTINLLYKRADQYEQCGTLKNPGGVVREVMFINEDYLVGVGGSGLRLMSPFRLTVTYQSVCSEHIYCVCQIDENVLVTGNELGCINVWDIRHQYPIQMHKPISNYTCVTSIDYNKNNDDITFSTNTGWCYTLPYNSLGNVNPVNMWLPHGNDECRSVRYSPDGLWILTGSYNGAVCLTNTKTHEYTKICQHEDKVIQARWCNSDQTVIATSSADKTVRLWKLNL